jgi:hypothetical protein
VDASLEVSACHAKACVQCLQIGTELGKGSDFSVLGEVELQGTSDGFHEFGLGGGTDSRDGKTDVDCGSDTLKEELGLQEDLSVGNRNDVGRNVGRDITSLGLNDGEGSEGTTTVGLVHLGGSLEQTRVEVEDISGVGLSSRRSSKQERHLSVGNGLLGQIVVDDQGVLAVVSEPFTHGTSRERSEVLKGSGVRGGSGNNNGVLQGVVLLEGLDELSDSRSLKTDSDVDTVELLLLVGSVVPLLLVEDGVNGNGGFTSLSITNDELSLSSTNLIVSSVPSTKSASLRGPKSRRT